jgi:hypothetical protein
MTPEQIKKRLADRYMTELMFREEAEAWCEVQAEFRERLLAEPQDDPVLRYMLDHDLSLSRDAWIARTYGYPPPKPWTAAHEATVPAVFRPEEEAKRAAKAATLEEAKRKRQPPPFGLGEEGSE